MSTVDFAASAGATNQFKQLGRKRGLNGYSSDAVSCFTWLAFFSLQAI